MSRRPLRQVCSATLVVLTACSRSGTIEGDVYHAANGTVTKAAGQEVVVLQDIAAAQRRLDAACAEWARPTMSPVNPSMSVADDWAFRSVTRESLGRIFGLAKIYGDEQAARRWQDSLKAADEAAAADSVVIAREVNAFNAVFDSVYTSHTVARVKTSVDGRYSVPSLPAGDYAVAGFLKVGDWPHFGVRGVRIAAGKSTRADIDSLTPVYGYEFGRGVPCTGKTFPPLGRGLEVTP